MSWKAWAMVAGTASTLVAVPAQARSRVDVCEKVAIERAKEEIEAKYTPSEIEEEQIRDVAAVQIETLGKGFENWSIAYSVGEECLETYTMLLRRARNGKTCAIIKVRNDLDRDCG